MNLIRKKYRDGKIKVIFCGIKIYSYKPKLGVSYNVFDGIELLESSIKSIRSAVEYINVIYQDVSYFGEKSEVDLKKILSDLKQRNLIDDFQKYIPEKKYEDTHEYEKQKRDMGLSLAKKNGCTHFISMDVDEFFDAEQLKKAKEKVYEYNISISACSIVEYLKSPEYQMVNNFTFNFDQEFYTFYMPFIMKIKKWGKQKHGKGFFPCLTDPTRKIYSKGKFYLFSGHEIILHHMSTVRKDLEKKYKSSNLNTENTKNYVFNVKQQVLNFDFEQNKKLLEDYSIFNYSIIKKVSNLFNIDV